MDKICEQQFSRKRKDERTWGSLDPSTAPCGDVSGKYHDPKFAVFHDDAECDPTQLYVTDGLSLTWVKKRMVGSCEKKLPRG